MKSVQVGRSQNLGNSSRKSLSAESTRGLTAATIPSAPCSCRECKQNSKITTGKTPRGLPIKNNPNSKGQDKGDYRGQSKTINTASYEHKTARTSSSRQILKTKFFPSNKENICEPNILRKSSSTTFLVKPRELVFASNSRPNLDQNEYGRPSPQESLIQLYRAPPAASRAPSVTEAVPVLRRNVLAPRTTGRHLTPVVSESTSQFFTQHLPGGNSSTNTCTCQCKNSEWFDESPVNSQTSIRQLKSTETVSFVDKSLQDCHQVHPAHVRRVAFATSSGKNLNQNSAAKLPPLPPSKPNRNQTQGQGQGHRKGSSTALNRQTTAILSVGVNTVGGAHLNNYRPKGNSHSSPSFIVETVSSTSLCGDLAQCTLARTLPFSREHELRRPTTSHSVLHGTESCTNLHSEPESPSDPCLKCPLCKETKSQISVHHRSMQSRYMSDLEWRICHAVNIYVYRNGVENQTPILVHIPPARKKNMKNVMAVIQDRMKYPIGYAKTLYKMDGTRIRHPCELEMYNNYVVGSNYDKHFKCVQYGRKRSPLLILARESKHVRVLRLQNEHYDQWLMKKKAAGDERPQYLYPVVYTQDGYGPADLPVGQGGNYQPCGPFCKLPNKRCGNMSHDNCGPGPNRMARNRQPYQQDYVVNTITIPTGSLRNPAHPMQQGDKLGGDDEDIESSSNNKNSDQTSRRYQSIGKNDESLFYGMKPKKKSKGVIDTSGDKKLFGEVDSNANLIRNEFDEIPDLSDPTPQYNVEHEVYEVVDETFEESPPQPDFQNQNEPTRKSKTKQTNENKSNSRNNMSISATSRSYTIVSKTSPPVQQGGTQTKKSKASTSSKSRKSREEGQNGSPNSNGVSFFVPIDPENEQYEVDQNDQKIIRTPRVEASNSAEESISGTSQGFHLNQNQAGTAGGFEQHQQDQQQSWNDQNQSNNKNYTDNNTMVNQQHPLQQQQQHPMYQAAMLNQGSTFRPFIIDGSARFASTGPYFASRDPEPQENFANQYDELSDIMAGTDEVDIPFTPLQAGSRNNTYRQQPMPNFYPPYQDFRFLSNVYNSNSNNGFMNNTGGNFNKVTIDKPKFRNVATQFGNPSFEEIVPTYKNSALGQQQMLQDSFQNQQMRMQQAIMQQQQLAQMSGQSGQIIYPPPVYLPPVCAGQQVEFLQQPHLQQQQQQNWNNNNRIQMQQPTTTTQQGVCIPPPTQFRDTGYRQNIRNPVTAVPRRTSSNNITQPRKSETRIVQGKKPSQRGQPTSNNGGRIP